MAVVIESTMRRVALESVAPALRVRAVGVVGGLAAADLAADAPARGAFDDALAPDVLMPVVLRGEGLEGARGGMAVPTRKGAVAFKTTRV